MQLVPFVIYLVIFYFGSSDIKLSSVLKQVLHNDYYTCCFFLCNFQFYCCKFILLLKEEVYNTALFTIYNKL